MCLINVGIQYLGEVVNIMRLMIHGWKQALVGYIHFNIRIEKVYSDKVNSSSVLTLIS